jgi:hypothetical protein
LLNNHSIAQSLNHTNPVETHLVLQTSTFFYTHTSEPEGKNNDAERSGVADQARGQPAGVLRNYTKQGEVVYFHAMYLDSFELQLDDRIHCLQVRPKGRLVLTLSCKGRVEMFIWRQKETLHPFSAIVRVVLE